MLTTKNWCSLSACAQRESVSEYRILPRLPWFASARWSRRLLLPAVLALGLAGGCTPSGPRALLSGERLMREGKYPQAVAKLETATRLLPGNAQAWNHLGLAYHKAGQATAALGAYEQARRLDPNLTPVHFNLGCLLLEQNNPAAAIPELTTYTLLQPESLPGWLKLGTAQLRAHQFEQAERSFQNSLRLQADSVEAWNGMGVAQAQRRRPREAINSFSSALQRQADYPPALLNTAIVYHNHLNSHAQALQKYQEYVALTPPPPEAAEVQDIVRRLQAELNPSPVHVEPRELTNAPSAEPLATEPTPAHTNATASNLAFSRGPTNFNTPSISAPGNNRSRSGPRSQLTAADLMPHGAKTASEPPKTASESPKRLEMAARTDPAIFDPSIRTAVTSPEPPSRTSAPASSSEVPSAHEAPAQSQAPPPVVEVVRVKEESLPKPAEDQAALARETNAPTVSASSAQMDKASALLSRKIDETPRETPPPEKTRVIEKLNPASWFRSKRRTPATTPLDGVSEESTEAMQPLAPAGHLAESATVAPLAFPRYAYHSPRKPAAGNRSKADPYFTEAVAAHRSGRLDEAVEGYRKATKLDPSFFEAQYNLGLAAYSLRDIPQSLSAYELALAINPHSINARYNFALALQQGGYFQDAANELETVINESPNEARAHFSVASLYAEKLGQPSLARPHYRKVLELEPQHPQALAIRYWLAANP